MTNIPPQVLKPSTLVSHRRYEKNTPPLRNLISSATDYLSSLSSFSNCGDTTMDYILVKSEASNMMYGTGNSISGNDVSSEPA